MRLYSRSAFTLVEILIVVIILGILAAIVVPKFADASGEAARGTAYSELEKLRRAVEVYMARNENALPPVEAGNGTWGPLIASSGEYLRSAPANPWVGGANARVITLGTEPDTEYQSDHGWIYDPATGQIWAGSFDADDNPLPRQ